MDNQNYGSRGTEREREADDRASDKIRETVDSVKRAADDIRSKDAETLAREARERAGELVSTAKEKTSEIRSSAAESVDQAMTTAGTQMTNLAHTVRERAPEGRAGEVANTAAQALERGGEYLQSADLQSVRTDLERVIRQHPIETLAVGVGIGYLLARATRR